MEGVTVTYLDIINQVCHSLVLLIRTVQTLRNVSKGVRVAKCDRPILLVLQNSQKCDIGMTSHFSDNLKSK